MFKILKGIGKGFMTFLKIICGIIVYIGIAICSIILSAFVVGIVALILGTAGGLLGIILGLTFFIILAGIIITIAIFLVTAIVGLFTK